MQIGFLQFLTLVMKHPDERRRTVRIAFTPDEEIGCGTDHFDIERFAAKEAYTVDGGKLGELEYENFNAASANIRISGRSVHPGDAKNLMVNAVLVGMELNALLPPSERPEHTEKYEGFYFLEEMDGTVDSALMKYLIRDHDRVLFEKRKETMQRAVDFINARYGEGTAVAEIRDQYYNMDGNLNPLECGQEGELCISGGGVSAGYIGNRAKENEAFVRQSDGTVLYRSGDLGYLRPDGNFVFLHRMDTQVMFR